MSYNTLLLRLIFSEKASSRPYNRKRLLVKQNNFFTFLHYTIFSVVYQCLEFPVKTTGAVSVAHMLSFSYEDSINLTSTISLHELHIDLLKLYISILHDLHWHIHTDTTSNKLFFWSLY